MSKPQRGQGTPINPEHRAALEQERIRTGARARVRELCDEIKRVLDEAESSAGRCGSGRRKAHGRAAGDAVCRKRSR
jgi:hypothetical protein